MFSTFLLSATQSTAASFSYLIIPVAFGPLLLNVTLKEMMGRVQAVNVFC